MSRIRSDSTSTASSDSSVETQSEKTKVFLGFVDEPADDSAKPLDSRLGGNPLWLDPQSPPRLELTTCGSCSQLMTLLLQINAALENTVYERMIYLFACKSPSCRRKPGSIKVFRGTLRDPEKIKRAEEEKEKQAQKLIEQENKLAETRKKMANMGNFLFSGAPIIPNNSAEEAAECASQPSSKKSFLEIASSNVATESPKASVEEKSELYPGSLTVPEPYPSFFLEVDNEYLDPDAAAGFTGPGGASSRQVMKSLRDEMAKTDQVEEKSSGSGGGAAGSEIVTNADESFDKTFQKFADRVAQNPQQVVRYELDGDPLLFSSTDEVGKRIFDENKQSFPICRHCSKPNLSIPKRFELQLMPHAITVLEKYQQDLNLGMEWGTIIISTCLADCCPILDENHVGYLEESVDVQWE